MPEGVPRLENLIVGARVSGVVLGRIMTINSIGWTRDQAISNVGAERLMRTHEHD